MKRTRIKQAVTALAAVIFSGAIGTAAMAQNWPEYGYRAEPHPLAHTDQYLDHHPEVARQLERHPGLIDDPRYVAEHPGLREFLATHRVARAEWTSHPYRYLHRENKYDLHH